MRGTRSARERAVEIVCATCGVRSVGGSVEAACRAYARHVFTAHGLTVSCADARALAKPAEDAAPRSPD